ncbi:hypothetical protein BGZ76_009390, partial [Entomortierella beljakovae]
MPIKGVTAFCEDSAQKGYHIGDKGVRLCVAKRRTIQFYNIFEGSISEPRELNLPNGALVVTRWENIVCVADGNDFNLIDTRVGRMIPVLPVVQNTPSGSNSTVLKPMCIPIAGNEFLLASATSSGQTAIGIFCTGNGDPVRGTLQWSSYPRALAIEYPYVAALVRGNIVEIHNIIDQQLVQSVQFDSSFEPRTLVQGPGIALWMSSLARLLALQHDQPHSESDSGSGQQNHIPSVFARILVAAKDGVAALVTTPMVIHADGLLQNGRVEEALLLSEKATSTMSSGNLHKDRLQLELDYIYQKSGLIYLGETLFDDGFGLLRRGKLDPRVPISMFPDVLQKPSLLKDVVMFQGIRDQVIKFGTLSGFIEKTISKSGSEHDIQYGKVLLHNAKDIFLHYLEQFRNENIDQKPRLAQQFEARAVDTALLGLWVDNGDDKSLLRLLESDNSCGISLTEPKLKLANKYYALSIWYRSQKNYKAALSLWKRLRCGELIDSSFDVPLKDIAILVSSLQDAELVRDYAWWIVEQDEAIGLKIFMPAELQRAAMFDPAQVIPKLRPLISQEGFLAYMEYVVLQRKSELAIHHNILIEVYIENITRLTADSDANAKHQEIVKGFTKQQQDYLLVLQRPKTTQVEVATQKRNSNTFILYLQSHNKIDPICSYRYKLCQVLQSSKLYDSVEILAKIEAMSELKIEKAILLSKLSRYEDCIKILVVELKDYKGAEIFCLNSGVFRNPRRSAKTSTNENLSTATVNMRKRLFMALLKEYLTIAQDQGGVTLTLELLDSQSTYLDLSEVINLLPPYWSVELLQKYLVRSLRRSYHGHKEIQIAKGLSLGENLRISEELYQLYETHGPRTGALRMLHLMVQEPKAQYFFSLQQTLIRYALLGCGRSVLMLNCGGLFNLEEYMNLSEEVTIYVLDSRRPVNLRNAFWNNEVIVFHENDLDKELSMEKDAIIFTEENEDERKTRRGAGSDGDDDDDDDDEDENGEGNDSDLEDRSEDGYDDDGNDRRQRRRTGIDSEVVPVNISRKWKESRAIIVDYMSKGSLYGTSISNQTYMMATQLDRTSVDILWLAIVGLTSQYINDYIGHKDYLDIVQIYKDESERLAPSEREGPPRLDELGLGSINDDGTIKCAEEYRFMMVRHWSLYESMYHSNYVASRLGIWREPGRKRLQALLAKMGFSLEECMQGFAHMSIDLKKILKDRLESVAPEYGLNEIMYTSFTRSYGFRGVLSASDVVYSVTSLLESSPEALVALGYRSERLAEETLVKSTGVDTIGEQEDANGSPSWWHANFFKACDSLELSGRDNDQLKQGLRLCMETQKAIVRQAIAIIEKQVIITLSTCRAATLKDGPDLPIFWNPLTLYKLAQFLVYAIR